MAIIHHHHQSSYRHHTTITTHRLLRRHSLDYSSIPSSSSSATTTSSSLSFPFHITFSLSSSSSTTTNPTTTTTITTSSIDTLQNHLEAGNFRQADEESRRLLIILAGESAIKRGYVFFSEVQFIPKEDLKAIDDLWKRFSNGRFGYSVQKKIWLKANKDFTRFFMKVGWMKKLENSEVEQYNYRSFPNDFMWHLNLEDDNEGKNGNQNNDDTSVPPEGHLPLTNALRGTQLLNSIFTHPAFRDDDDDDDDDEVKDGNKDDDQGFVVDDEVDMKKKKSRLASLRDRLFKPNYSF